MSQARTKIMMNKPSKKAVSFESEATLEYVAYLKKKYDSILYNLGLPPTGVTTMEVTEYAQTNTSKTLIDRSYTDEFLQGVLIGGIITDIILQGGEYEEDTIY